MALSRINANSITDDSITVDQIADNSVHGRRNLVINGAMQVAQRGDVTGITGANVYGGADRFATNGTGYGTVSLVQEADAPEGFAESQRVKFTTARSTTAAGDHFIIGTRLEGQNLQRFKKGTSNAESMTVSFYAKASQATTIQLELFDSDNTRHAGKEFAITTSWARYSYTFAGDTTGAFTNDNGLSMYVFFWLGAGTTWTSGTNPDGSWIADVNNRRVHSDVGTTFMDTLNAEFNLTGVQLEVGDKATPFEHRSFGEELTLCERYFQKYECSAQQLIYFEGNTANHKFTHTNIYRKMRATPTVSLSTNFGHGGGAGGTINSVTTQSIGPDRVSYRVGFTSAHGSSYELRHSDSFDGDVASYSAEL